MGMKGWVGGRGNSAASSEIVTSGDEHGEHGEHGEQGEHYVRVYDY